MSNNNLNVGISESIGKKFELKTIKIGELREKILGSLDIEEKDLNRFYINKMNDSSTYITDTMIQKAALETSIIIINITKDNKYQLIDGFLRLFSPNTSNSDIIVKVYRNLDDTEYLNELFYCNLWKVRSSDSRIDFFDRGFMLSLYNRYKINICKILDLDSYYIKNLLRLYCWDNNLSILLDNKYFIHDIKQILEVYLNYKANTSDDIIDKKYKDLIETYVGTVGLVRIQYPKIEQEKLRTEDIYNLLEDNEIRSILKNDTIDISFLKLCIYYKLSDIFVPNSILSHQEMKNKYKLLISTPRKFYKYTCQRDVDLFNINISYLIKQENNNKAAIEVLKEIIEPIPKAFDDFYYYDGRRRKKKCKETFELLDKMRVYLQDNDELDDETLENINSYINNNSKYLTK